MAFAYINGVRTEIPDPPPPSLAEARQFVAAAISIWALTEATKNITALSTEWETTPEARSKLVETLLVGDNPSGVWTDAFDVERTVTFTQLRNAFIAIRNRDATIRARIRAMKTEAAGLTVPQLLAYVPSF